LSASLFTGADLHLEWVQHHRDQAGSSRTYAGNRGVHNQHNTY